MTRQPGSHAPVQSAVRPQQMSQPSHAPTMVVQSTSLAARRNAVRRQV